MAIGYTPQTWVNGSAPALSAANLQTMDNGINAACDALDAMAVDGTGIPDATTAIKGRVALATTGVEEATKVPKATGADLAALLTAGGYTLTAPSGANSLDGIADTATWKKVAAAVATALNANTYTANDADKVSAFGIGATKTLSSGTDLNTIITNGIYAVTNPTQTNLSGDITSLPAGNYTVTVERITNTMITQRAVNPTSFVEYIRFLYSGSNWYGWWRVWNSAIDGNGGQPPSPKPRAATTSDIGHFARLLPDAGVAATLPSGGTWAYMALLHNASTGALVGSGISVAAGGTEVGAASAGNQWTALIWRVA